eukprot:gnl/TRDRNA2_/TRDRNA2_39727_c0_seq1.p1 gnl/TRDRNA2_/TRDRNA2_39727_c0~~gnl/TRDRNA2_/TRDRNA2_39727_c0_seq1.p1  ORF type:complete len:317 (-),score=46.84 gnl/TRDRNA2_/TRDRNA2_39727_c0_seq1:72-1022(-)
MMKGQWTCPACGFKNKAENVVCGGYGRLGCKQKPPRPWLCACGMENKSEWKVCGGNGGGGCRAAKPKEEITTEMGGGPANQPPPDQQSWLCQCGFLNRPSNTYCGGTGPMGCKKQRAESETQPMEFGMMAEQRRLGNTKGQREAKGIAKGYDSKLVCNDYLKGKCDRGDRCKFEHIEGAEGIEATEKDKARQDKREPWLCTCGFQNRPSNLVCGGTGEKGCKMPMPTPPGAQELALEATFLMQQQLQELQQALFAGINPYALYSLQQQMGSAGAGQWQCDSCGTLNSPGSATCSMGCVASGSREPPRAARSRSPYR